MKTIIKTIPIDTNENQSLKKIFKYIERGNVVHITRNLENQNKLSKPINIKGPALIFKSSGSIYQPKLCIHSIKNLDLSAESTGIWLEKLGIELSKCLIFNSLPLNHISGFMPLWRSRLWGCSCLRISPNLIKETKKLLEYTIKENKTANKYLITSLVPTQLNRLIKEKEGIEWLKNFTLIWVGGASISNEIAELCRKESINIAPCYGATETAAMISCLDPNSFLKGQNDVGSLLNDVSIQINQYGLIKVKTKRLGIELLKSYNLQPFSNKEGWWESGDIGEIIKIKNLNHLNYIRRADNAFNSGGETVFPEIIKLRLKKFIFEKKIPITNIYFSVIKDEVWENRYEIYLDFKKNTSKEIIMQTLDVLKIFAKDWPRHEKPTYWKLTEKIHICNSINEGNWKDNNKL